MTQYAAFLRGINVGGRKPVKMEDLRKAFAALGFQNVKTMLASGNVLFDTVVPRADALVKSIEEILRGGFRARNRRAGPFGGGTPGPRPA
jgi:uncharacterized protein (DUF1697 family)